MDRTRASATLMSQIQGPLVGVVRPPAIINASPASVLEGVIKVVSPVRPGKPLSWITF